MNERFIRRIKNTREKSSKVILFCSSVQVLMFIIAIAFYFIFKTETFIEKELNLAKTFNIGFGLPSMLYFITYVFLLRYLKTNFNLSRADERFTKNLDDDDKIFYKAFVLKNRYFLQRALFFFPLAFISFFKHSINCITGLIYLNKWEFLWIIPILGNTIYLIKHYIIYCRKIEEK